MLLKCNLCFKISRTVADSKIKCQVGRWRPVSVPSSVRMSPQGVTQHRRHCPGQGSGASLSLRDLLFSGLILFNNQPMDGTGPGEVRPAPNCFSTKLSHVTSAHILLVRTGHAAPLPRVSGKWGKAIVTVPSKRAMQVGIAGTTRTCHRDKQGNFKCASSIVKELWSQQD